MLKITYLRNFFGRPDQWLTFSFLLLLFAVPAKPDQKGESGAADLSEQSLEQLMNVRVVSAAMHDQNLSDAPGDVTVITSKEIRQWGYRTLADALSYVRGFYLSPDLSYTYVGARGFSLPGDYETRLVVQVNGHSMLDNVFDSNAFFGNDFAVDLDVVDRIEIVRGPSSALYGSSSILATINVVTKRPAEAEGTRVRVEAGSLRQRKVVVTQALALGKGANLLLSGSAFNNAGQRVLYFPEFNAPENNFGRAINMDGEKGYHAFADLTWGNWEVLAVAGNRVKIQPISYGDTIFNDRGTRVEDTRAFVEVIYTKDLPGDRTFSWRTSFDEYRYRGIYHAPSDTVDVIDSREQDYGDWLKSRLIYRLPDGHAGHLTVGTETRVDLRSMQNVFNVYPSYVPLFRIGRSDRYIGAFAQQEWALGSKWELNVGGRFDWSWLRRDAFSPRAALLYKPSKKQTYKIMYGRGFRNPSNYEMFFEDGSSFRANPSLLPETTNSYEFDAEHQFTKRLRASASVYHYQLGNLIQQTYADDGLAQSVNAGSVRALGSSFEIGYALAGATSISAALDLQRAVFTGSNEVLPNSPGQIGKLRYSVPLLRQRFTLNTGVQALGERRTYTGNAVPPAVLPEVSVTTKSFWGGWQLNAGVKNFSDTDYRDPIGLTPAVDSIRGQRRSFYVNIRWESPSHREGPLSADSRPAKQFAGSF